MALQKITLSCESQAECLLQKISLEELPSRATYFFRGELAAAVLVQTTRIKESGFHCDRGCVVFEIWNINISAVIAGVVPQLARLITEGHLGSRWIPDLV